VRRLSAGPGRIDQQGSEALYPSVDRDVIYFDATFGHEFFNVAVGQSVSEVPTDSQHDDFRREPVASERGAVHRWLRTLVIAHLDSFARTESRSLNATVPLRVRGPNDDRCR
jgi:hypothetical protein